MAKIIIKSRYRKNTYDCRTYHLGIFTADVRFTSNNDIELTISDIELDKIILMRDFKKSIDRY